eukprot:CAMPEP_0114677210 /NCGR_PEP_ID=MMETSP0191-20121206/50242_1 /TAXON_ID=126664 /ORGANISM="Sorites sp." /LENGTH=69 /DNA_ID=CAMNT_0001949449 /DNA_START=39 /DNA_END=245 /DNA_ORIENTATION=+
MPQVDPQTGQRSAATGGQLTSALRQERSAEGLKGKAKLHKDFWSQPKRQQDVYFGQNALCEFHGATDFE